MDIIEAFLNQYSRQLNFYTELARIGRKKLESELAKRGIKAIVTYRAKRPEQLKRKLIKRNEEKRYKTIQSIFEDIVDLAGVRVSLYFPSDRELVDEIINEIFIVIKKKVFPESSYKPKYTKRFSGYWATHYRVEIKKLDKLYERYQNTLFEIQVASVLMHAWAEVEHDLVYKSYSGGSSEEELAILDEINGLVLSGEIALERLQKAMTKRTMKTKEFSDRYELTNFIVNSLNRNYLNKLKLGDTKILNNYFKTISSYDTDILTGYLKKINQNANETISDQLLNMFIRDYYKEGLKDKSMKGYFIKVLGPDRDTSDFEFFIKTWIVLEKSISVINEENNIAYRNPKYTLPKFDDLVKLEKLEKSEVNELEKFRRIKNQVLHGFVAANNNYLRNSCLRLYEITEKLIRQILDKDRRIALLNELK